jgi:hypothetical protein
VSGSQWNTNPEYRPDTTLALSRNLAAVQPYQFLDQGKSDARSLMRPRFGMFDAVKAFEQARHLIFRDADARISDLENRVIVGSMETD